MEDKVMKICPFNKSHVVEDRRFLVHIDRCRKTASNVHEFTQCTFNSIHYIRKEEKEEHEKHCPNRQMFEKILFDESTKFCEVAELIDNTKALNLDDNDWDTTTSALFNPSELKAKAPHMVLPEGLPKAERSRHWEKERRRLLELENTFGGPFRPEPMDESKLDEAEEETVATRLPTSRIAARIFPVTNNLDDGVAPGFKVVSPLRTIGRGRGLLGRLVFDMQF